MYYHYQFERLNEKMPAGVRLDSWGKLLLSNPLTRISSSRTEQDIGRPVTLCRYDVSILQTSKEKLRDMTCLPWNPHSGNVVYQGIALKSQIPSLKRILFTNLKERLYSSPLVLLSSCQTKILLKYFPFLKSKNPKFIITR